MHRTARITAVAAPLALIIALSGCAATDAAKPAGSASSSATGTAKAAEKAPTITIGDAVGQVKDGKPVIITDEWGPYQKMTLNPDAKFFTTIPAQNDGSAKENGFTDADILDAEKWLGTFITEETIDSDVLDAKDGTLSDWVNENRKYLTESLQQIAEQQGDDANLVVGGLWNGKAEQERIPGRMARNSKPRASSVTVNYSAVSGVTDNDKPYLVFDGTTATRYIADNKAFVDGYAKRGFSLDQVKQHFPNIDSAKPLAVQSDVTFEYALLRNGAGWAIGGWTLKSNHDLTD